tara:strand:- start:29822 stop:30235 length:414 start_codon:yes stop_codon:yes gene_type:complete
MNSDDYEQWATEAVRLLPKSADADATGWRERLASVNPVDAFVVLGRIKNGRLNEPKDWTTLATVVADECKSMFESEGKESDAPPPQHVGDGSARVTSKDKPTMVEDFQRCKEETQREMESSGCTWREASRKLFGKGS